MLPALGTKIAGLTRRQLLLRGALATGGLMVAGFMVRVGLLFGESPGRGRRVLSPREIATLAALIKVALPGGDDMPPGDVEFITHYVDDYLAGSDPDVRLLFKATIQVVEEAPLLTRFSRFTSLPPDLQLAEVKVWEHTPTYLKRTAFQSVKMMIGMAYFEQPGPSDAVGWYVGCAPPHLLHKSKNRLREGAS